MNQQHVEIVQLSPQALDALAAGELDAAKAASELPLTAYFVDDEWRGVWRRRSEQVRTDPASAAWVTGAVIDVPAGIAVGRAGYHGPPDAAGMVEVGYAIDPEFRRRGYARAALQRLLDRASAEPGVATVRASVRPDNVASLALIAQFGFVAIGRQWDDEDGWEIVHEVGADIPGATSGYVEPSLPG